MPKFRSMKSNTPEVATHLLDNPKKYLTPIGNFLRKTSLDEIPQLFSIIKGDMSFIGPRPALFNQTDLIAKRKQEGIDFIRPGLTGYAQINGRDELSNEQKVKYDKIYKENISFFMDIKIVFLSIYIVLSKDGINH